ncbi:MAG: histidine phosphatase family protein [Erysipelotrichaceae bacterium]|nr:histidine phosphatase family protein [Erysipelotrichaceae bacterium]
MKDIYLIRHAKTTAPTHHCIGSTDYPLSDQGIRQTKKLAAWIKEALPPVDVLYSSQCQRAVHTARILSDRTGWPLVQTQAFNEIHLGIWEDHSFDWIAHRDPIGYQQRIENLWAYRIEGAQTFEEACRRFRQGLEAIREDRAVVVTHAGLIRAMVADIHSDRSHLLEIPCPNLSMTHLSYTNGQWECHQTGVLPLCCLDETAVEALYQKYQTPPAVIEHMKAVRDQARDILSGQTKPFDWAKIEAACLLHDLCRDKYNHAAAAGSILIKEGYPDVAALVAAHHKEDYDPIQGLSEADIVWIADKMVQGTQRVSIQTRFEASKKKCRDPQARRAHQKRYEKALWIHQQLKEGSEQE